MTNEKRTADLADLADMMVVLGLMLVGVALWAWLGWAALAAYVGTILVISGLVLAVQRGRSGGTVRHE